MSNLTSPVEKLSQDAKGYIDESFDNLKLQASKGLSQVTGTLAGLAVILLVLGALLMVLAFAGGLLLGEILNSYALAAFIIAGVLLLLLIILYLCRGVLFRNSFVKIYTDIFSPEEAKAYPIASQKELDAALARSKNRIQKREDSLTAGVENVRTFYSPKHLLTMGLRQDVLPIISRLLLGRKKKRLPSGKSVSQ